MPERSFLLPKALGLGLVPENSLLGVGEVLKSGHVDCEGGNDSVIPRYLMSRRCATCNHYLSRKEG